MVFFGGISQAVKEDPNISFSIIFFPVKKVRNFLWEIHACKVLILINATEPKIRQVIFWLI